MSSNLATGVRIIIKFMRTEKNEKIRPASAKAKAKEPNCSGEIKRTRIRFTAKATAVWRICPPVRRALSRLRFLEIIIDPKYLGTFLLAQIVILTN